MFDTVSQENFTDYIKVNETVIAFFTAAWCGACRLQDPILNRVIETLSNRIKIAQIDVDQNPNLARAYHILGTPTLMFFKKGNLVRFKSKGGGRIDKLVGVQELTKLQGIIQYVINMKIVNE